MGPYSSLAQTESGSHYESCTGGGGARHASIISLTLAGAEIREDHLCIERVMHPYTGGVLTMPRQQKAAGGDRCARRRGLARLLGAYPLLEDRIARLDGCTGRVIAS